MRVQIAPFSSFSSAAGFVGLVSSLLRVTSVEAGLIPNYSGVGSWFDPSLWHGGSVPTSDDEIWFNTPSTSATVGPDEVANADKLVIGRHVPDASLIIDGGRLNVGNGNGGDVLFVGQYSDADGTATLKSGGFVYVDGEFAVSVAGRGTYVQESGVATVWGRFVIGRYEVPDAVGIATIRGGTVTCERFDVNSRSRLNLEGGMLIVRGNHVAKIEGYVSSGKVAGDAEIKVLYDAEEDRTRVYAKKYALFDYDGLKSSDPPVIWSTPEGWRHSLYPDNPVPTPYSEIWMNKPDTSVTVVEGTIATADKLIVGRHATNVELINDGGEIIIGDWESDGAARIPGSILFLGQYHDASGLLVQKSGIVRVSDELAVAVSGPGEMRHLGGRTEVAGRLVVGRQNLPSSSGRLYLSGGVITASRLDVNDYSRVEMEEGGVLRIKGDSKSKIEGYIAQGKVTSSGSVEVIYDTVEDVTVVTSSSWDVQGILSFTEAEVGPRMPRDKLVGGGGPTVRTFEPAPPHGVHPRIFFGPDEIDQVRDRLENTAVGREVRFNAQQLMTLMREGRTAYETQYKYNKTLPDGETSRVSNAGLYSTDTTYKELIAGVTTSLATLSFTHLLALAGVMALEALDCLVFPDEPDATSRAADLAEAMYTWANWALSLPESTFGPAAGNSGGGAARDWFGGQHMAFAYDLNHHAMTEEQRGVVRRGIARMIWLEERFTGITLKPYATTSNWVVINSFTPMMILAIEGETTEAEHGWSTQRLETYFRNIMMANYKFFTYGWYAEGAPYEGEGKNYQYDAMIAAYAKRGYNFFKHSHVQSYATEYMPAMLQPHGHFITTYDVIGGTSVDFKKGEYVWGQSRYFSNDIIGMKFAYPEEPAVDFAYRQFLETPYSPDGVTKAVMLDATDQKVTPRSTYHNSMLSLLIMASDYTEGNYNAQNQVAQGGFTFNGKERGIVITQSGYSEEALKLQFHNRQDMGGHTYGDRNSFTLSGLGRSWVRNPVGNLYQTEWSSSILVNNMGVAVTDLEGDKSRQPGRITYHLDTDAATFTGGDATYAYNTEWYWVSRANDTVHPNVPVWLQDPPRDPDPFGPVTETWNDFRAPGNKIPEYFGDIAFYDYAHWYLGGTWLEGCQKRAVNDLSQFYRQAGLVRGNHPYALIVDDVHKFTDSANTVYKWIAQIPDDLIVMPVGSYTGTNLNEATDIVLMEPSVPPSGAEGKSLGTRRLLIRVLNAEGDRTDGTLARLENLTYYHWGANRKANRLTITRKTEHPRFQIMLYPYKEGGEIPSHSFAPGGYIQTWEDGQVDALSFNTIIRTVAGENVEITEVGIERNGVSIIQTRADEVSPTEMRW